MKARQHRIFVLDDKAGFTSVADTILRALHWAGNFDCFHFFNDNRHHTSYPFGGFPVMLAAGARRRVPIRKGHAFADLQALMDQYPDWLIGYFGYDLKNETEKLTSDNPDGVLFPEAGFYVPQHIIFFREEEIEVTSFEEPEGVFQAILATPIPDSHGSFFNGTIEQRTPKEKYLTTVAQLREHILDGDVYEINYCVEFFAQQADLEPLSAYLSLNALSPMPFSVFGKTDNHYLLCASPERFLKKTANRLISMPIKGTVRRGSSPAEDTILKDQLHHSEKERAENMMIVDLVRNDLARSAVPGTVRVDEMFGVYTFATLHQMISTVSAQLRPEVVATEAIRNAFPMGSMTGAPKIKAMQLIEQYEDTRRGLYSGAVGYFTPEGDFDFNVVIRSILYNADTRYLSFSVGSAITYDSVAEAEYEECLLKAQTIQRVLSRIEL